VGLQGALDSADDGGAPQRPHDCLLHGLVERAVDAGDVRHPLGTSRPGVQEAGDRRLSTIGLHVRAIIPRKLAPSA
jgi:hypothetical protein